MLKSSDSKDAKPNSKPAASQSVLERAKAVPTTQSVMQQAKQSSGKTNGKEEIDFEAQQEEQIETNLENENAEKEALEKMLEGNSNNNNDKTKEIIDGEGLLKIWNALQTIKEMVQAHKAGEEIKKEEELEKQKKQNLPPKPTQQQPFMQQQPTQPPEANGSIVVTADGDKVGTASAVMYHRSQTLQPEKAKRLMNQLDDLEPVLNKPTFDERINAWIAYSDKYGIAANATVLSHIKDDLVVACYELLPETKAPPEKGEVPNAVKQVDNIVTTLMQNKANLTTINNNDNQKSKADLTTAMNSTKEMVGKSQAEKPQTPVAAAPPATLHN